MAAPTYETMDRDAGPKLLKSHERLFVKQTKRGCIKELFGCEATNEFKIYPSKDEVRTVYYWLSARSGCGCTGLPQCCCLARHVTDPPVPSLHAFAGKRH